MTDSAERYDLYTAAAWIRGHAKATGIPSLTLEQLNLSLDDLEENELEKIVTAGEQAALRLYPFKNGKKELPRVRRVMGFLHSLQFETLLDVGSGRGVFLMPFMKEFPWVQVTALDLLEKRVEFLNELAGGGYPQLQAVQKDLCEQPFPERSYDVVTLLEVLEHIPDVGQAVKAAVKMAKQYVVVTVPSKPDNNPEHIHLLTKEVLKDLFEKAGCTKLHFDGVEGHLFLVAAITPVGVLE